MALIGLANLLALLVQGRTLVRQLYLNADHASALALPALASHAPSGAVIDLGDHPWYEPWWLMRATVGLPHYRQLWEAFPFAFALLGIAAVAACAWRALGASAGLLSAVVLLSTSAALRGILYVPESRVLLVLHMAALCAGLLLAHRRAREGRLRSLALISVPLIVFTAAGATDQLLIVDGLAPFVLAPVFCWWRYRSLEWRIVVAFAAAVGLLSLLLAALLTSVMNGEHVIHAPFPVSFVQGDAIFTSLEGLVRELASLGGGSFFGTAVKGTNLLTFATGALVLVALALIAHFVWRSLSAKAPHRSEAVEVDPIRELFTSFWGVAFVFGVASYVLTSVSETAGDGRYLLGAWVAAAALLGSFKTTRAEAWALAGVFAFGVLSFHAVVSEPVPAYGIAPDAPIAGDIEHFADAHGAEVGYSGYWAALPITWETHLRLKVYPLSTCSPPGATVPDLCPFGSGENTISSWYSAQPGDRRTFLLTDALQDDPLKVSAPPASFGPAVAQASFGAFTIYIYDHNIAGDLGSSPAA